MFANCGGSDEAGGGFGGGHAGNAGSAALDGGADVRDSSLVDVATSTEICDGLDNNQNGQVDEGCACSPGSTQGCYLGDPAKAGKGACTFGHQLCVKQQTSGEIQDGAWGPCEGSGQPTTEVCDGNDNDCNGQIDETCGCQAGDKRACYTGPQGTSGVGTCKAGTQTCAPPNWGGCEGSVGPSIEICDGLDNDCNGTIDDVSLVSCQTPCGAGVQQCQNGHLSTCAGPSPSPEVCDGKDNDCNGQIDENLIQGCSSQCGLGTKTCTGGTWSPCNAPQPSAEVCDGTDNNCDGTVDEGCSCTNGATQPCYTGPANTQGVGVCKAGQQTCANSAWGPCLNVVGPTIEQCNGLDDDCNGQVDDNLTKQCSTVCGNGVQACQNGQWGVCNGQQPTAEICNNLDDNCNNQVDEGITQPCSTACGSGTQTCSAGSFGLCNITNPNPEICGNGIDDNCNGQTDEGCTCTGSPTFCFNDCNGNPIYAHCEGTTWQCDTPPTCTCTPNCSTDTCGQPDGCPGGVCKCCYKCVGGDFYYDTAYCQQDVKLANGDGSCPAGYDTVPQDCRPCHDCRVSNGYCPNAGCCGTWTTTGTVAANCTCFGCTGFAYDFDQTTSCDMAKNYSHVGGPSPNSPCPYPTGGLSADCGYYKPDCSCWIVSCGGTCAL